MAKRAKLANVGEVDTVDQDDIHDASFTPPGNDENTSQDTGEEGGISPEALAAMASEFEEDSEEDSAEAPPAPAPVRAPAPPPPGDNKAPSLSPKMQLNALKRTVTSLGAQHGKGKTSMIALAEVVTEAAQDGVINESQTGEIYDKFREGVAAQSQYEDAGEVPDEAAMERIPANAGGDKSRDQQLSKLRQFIFLGNRYDTDALDLIRRARNLHIDLLRQAQGSDEAKRGIKPGSTYAVLVDVARAQLKKQKEAVEAGKKSGVKHTGLAPVLTNDELYGLMTQEVVEKEPMTGEEKLLAAYITAKAAYNGSNRQGKGDRNPVPSEELANAIEWLRAALGRTAPELLKEHDDEVAQSEAAKAERKAKAEEAKAAKAEAAAVKSATPKPTKAARQAALGQEGAAA